MTGFRFLHCADIHLDSPLRGLSDYPGAPVEKMRAATRRALENMITLAVEQRVDFVVVAGDLYDGDWRDFQTGLFFVQQMAKLGRAGIEVIMVLGNHDAQAVITKSLPPQPHVRILAADRPETIILDSLDVALHGQSFPQRAVTANLAAAYPPPRPGLFNIGLLHTALSGRPGHEPYAPCRVEQLINHGYDYWALGHIHAREVVHETPHIVFPGNLQGRNIRETGAKGATLVQVESGRIVALGHHAVDVVRWSHLDVGTENCADTAEVLARIRRDLDRACEQAEDRTLAVRIRLSGRTAAHEALARDPLRLREEIRAVATGLGDDDLWIEKIEIATRPARDPGGSGNRDDATSEILAALGELAASPEARDALRREILPLWDKLPARLREDLADPTRDDGLSATLAEVEDLVLSALADAGDPA